MLKIQLLTQEQCWGQYTALQVLKDYGVAAGLTDFAIASGGYPSSAGEKRYTHVVGDLPVCPQALAVDLFGNNFGHTYTSSADDDGALMLVGEHGTPLYTTNLSHSRYAIRPVLTTENPNAVPFKNVQKYTLPSSKQVQIGECYVYPSTLDLEMTERYRKDPDILDQKTGKIYTFNAQPVDSPLPFKPAVHPEYAIQNQKYICFVAKKDAEFLSSLQPVTIYEGRPYLFRVEPLHWLIDEDINPVNGKKQFTYVCLRGILGGIPFDQGLYCSQPYHQMFISRYIDNYLSKEIMPTEAYRQPQKKISHSVNEEAYIADMTFTR